MNGEPTNRTEETASLEGPAHETATHAFYVQRSGCVMARVKATGYRLPDSEVQTLLLLDIAQSLADLRLWGMAQNLETGQRVYHRD